MPDGLKPDEAQIEETARLLMMDDEVSGIVSLSRALQQYHAGVTPALVTDIWRKYKGLDGRSLPTHDLWTGRRYSPVETSSGGAP